MVKLNFYEEGNSKSNKLIVFLQGWPDNHNLWECLHWREDLSNYKIVFIDFPNTAGTVDNKWGYDFPEIVDGIKEALASY